MKLWFGKKDVVETSPVTADVPAATSAVPVEPVAPVAPVAEATPSPTTEPTTSKKSELQEPLQPATTLVRPPSNQKVLYYQLMNGLYDAVLILDDNGHVVDCNDRVSPTLGYLRDEMWDMPISAVIKGVGPQIFTQMKDALHNDHQVLITATCTRKDGGVFKGEIGVCLMHLTRGENLVFMVRNVEKREAALREKILRELQEPPVQARHVLKPVLRAASVPASAATPQTVA